MIERGAIAFRRARADERYWTEHWATESLDHLLAVAETSQATRFIERHVHSRQRMLEAGCGLGQYVAYFAGRGVNAAGVDFSRQAIEAHRVRFPGADVRVADLERLPFPDASFNVYLSLGVIEHYEDGGASILREAHRVLVPDGTLVLSTPYLSLSRRVLRRRIERRQEELAAAGAEFYQYAFDERTLDGIVAQAGFDVVDRSYYDPGRGVRDVRALLRGDGYKEVSFETRQRPPRRHPPLKLALLYTRPTLKLFAHMQIVAARKRSAAITSTL